MKSIKNIQYICGFILLQIFVEGCITMGYAFEFEKYNLCAWVVQVVTTLFTITLSLRIANEKELEI